jgi:DNA-binding beta-propeller fold protein YncE
MKRAKRNTVSTIAGTAVHAHRRDAEGTAVAEFRRPCGVAVDRDGNFIVTDNHSITPKGHVSTLAGTADKGY